MKINKCERLDTLHQCIHLLASLIQFGHLCGNIMNRLLTSPKLISFLKTHSQNIREAYTSLQTKIKFLKEENEPMWVLFHISYWRFLSCQLFLKFFLSRGELDEIIHALTIMLGVVIFEMRESIILENKRNAGKLGNLITFKKVWHLFFQTWTTTKTMLNEQESDRYLLIVIWPKLMKQHLSLKVNWGLDFPFLVGNSQKTSTNKAVMQRNGCTQLHLTFRWLKRVKKRKSLEVIWLDDYPIPTIIAQIRTAMIAL